MSTSEVIEKKEVNLFVFTSRKCLARAPQQYASGIIHKEWIARTRLEPLGLP